MSFGKALVDFGSDLLSGPLGVVQLGYKGYDLGLTVDTTTLKPDLDVKDIMFQQKGTKPADHVITGADWLLAGSFGEIKTELLKIIAPYIFKSAGSLGNDSGVFTAELYESLLETVAGTVRVSSVKDQTPSEVVENSMYFYLGIFLINAELINWGADVQRNLPFEIRLKPKQITSGESTLFANKPVHGYFGDPTAEDLPAATWPDLDAPYAVSALVAAATSVEVTLSENATEIGAVTSTEQMVVKVDDKFVVPTVVAYATNVITLTLPAASIAAGQVVEFSSGAGTFEDGSSNPNEEINNFPVTNSL